MATKKAQIDMLRSVSLFEGFTKKELQAIADVGREVYHEPGEDIVRRGAKGVGFHLILEGSAGITTAKGKVKHRLGPGDYFGEVALLDGGTRLATVTAVDRVRCLSIATWDFAPLLEDNWKLANKIIFGLCKLIRDQGIEDTL
jgi:CRP/FNR family transcriptional regulator, cyclic AMP receptor protein